MSSRNGQKELRFTLDLDGVQKLIAEFKPLMVLLRSIIEIIGLDSVTRRLLATRDGFAQEVDAALDTNDGSEAFRRSITMGQDLMDATREFIVDWCRPEKANPRFNDLIAEIQKAWKDDWAPVENEALEAMATFTKLAAGNFRERAEACMKVDGMLRHVLYEARSKKLKRDKELREKRAEAIRDEVGEFASI